MSRITGPDVARALGLRFVEGVWRNACDDDDRSGDTWTTERLERAAKVLEAQAHPAVVQFGQGRLLEIHSATLDHGVLSFGSRGELYEFTVTFARDGKATHSTDAEAFQAATAERKPVRVLLQLEDHNRGPLQ